jgi:competence protein ComEA
MPFMDDFDEVRDKFPTKRLSRPVLLGIACLTAVFAILAALGVATSARGDFMVEYSASSSPAAIEVGESSVSHDEAQDSSSTATKLLVHVVGAVKHPGVYELEADARVNDAVKAAGGLAKDADTRAVNLARSVADGEQVAIPAEGETPQAEKNASSDASEPASNAPEGITADGRVNLNVASQEELESLPGIGAVTARKIIESREIEGPFTSPEDLKRVSGIGDKKYESVSALICV